MRRNWTPGSDTPVRPPLQRPAARSRRLPGPEGTAPSRSRRGWAAPAPLPPGQPGGRWTPRLARHHSCAAWAAEWRRRRVVGEGCLEMQAQEDSRDAMAAEVHSTTVPRTHWGLGHRNDGVMRTVTPAASASQGGRAGRRRGIVHGSIQRAQTSMTHAGAPGRNRMRRNVPSSCGGCGMCLID